jgi:dihydropyrimidinase
VSELVLTGGALVLEDRVERGDLVVRDGKIAGVGCAAQCAAEVVDCRGAYVFPGLIDLHVHVADRIGAFALADDWESGSRAALPTGLTTLAAFATQAPEGSATVEETVDAALARAEGRSLCDFALHFTPTRWDEGAWRSLELLAARGHRTVKLYTTYETAGLLASPEILRRVLERAAALDLTVMLHCEDDDTLRRAAAVPSIDWREARAHALSRPAEAELRAVERAIDLCRTTGGRLHVVHVSTPAAARSLRDAAASLPITCETCPQYLALDETSLAGPDGHLWLCSPPLRSPEARAEMLELARDGAFDVLATDHCAFSRHDKATGAGRDVRMTPNGIAGLGALAPLGRELLLGEGFADADVVRFARMLSTSPARVLGLHPRKGALRVGSDADLAVVRLDAPPRPIRSSVADVHETYENRASRWSAERVYLRGALVAASGRPVDGAPKGAPAWR